MIATDVVLEFTVPGEPFGKERPRFVGGGRCRKPITPPKTRAVELRIQGCAEVAMWDLPRLQRRRFPLDEPLSLTVTFLLERPTKPKFDHPCGTPDVDNLVKTVLDGLQKAKVYRNDSRIVHVVAWKAWATGKPCTIVRLALVQDLRGSGFETIGWELLAAGLRAAGRTT